MAHLKNYKSNQELFQRVKDLNLPIGEYAIFGSGPMGIRGIREMGDVDIIVTQKLWDYFINKSDWEQRQIDNLDGMKNEKLNIEIWKDWWIGWNVEQMIKEAEIIGGLAFVNLEMMIEWKTLIAREKDLKDLELIKNWQNKTMKKTRALLLMSGGLDSVLAVKILQIAGVQVTPICFKSFFFGCEQAEKACNQLGLKLKIVDFSKKHLTMLKAPKFGRGSAFNPCIDCHLLMFKEAKKIMFKDKYDFIATGEVLGERPMSQNARALELIEKEAKLKGLIVRPLSLKVLPETIPERNGVINRDNFYGISGRSRKPQLQLVKDFGIKDFVSPGGGCILTDKNYSENLKTLLNYKKNINENDAQIIRTGRVFWQEYILIVVARDKAESQALKKMRVKGDIYLEPKNFSGPSVIIRLYKNLSHSLASRKIKEEMVLIGKKYLLQFSKKIPENPNIGE